VFFSVIWALLPEINVMMMMMMMITIPNAPHVLRQDGSYQ